MFVFRVHPRLSLRKESRASHVSLRERNIPFCAQKCAPVFQSELKKLKISSAAAAVTYGRQAILRYRFLHKNRVIAGKGRGCLLTALSLVIESAEMMLKVEK